MKHITIEEEVKTLSSAECKLSSKLSSKIVKLSDNKSVYLSSTLSGQRELLRQLKNSINEIITWIHNHERNL